LEFSLEIGKVNDEGVFAFARQGEQEISAIHVALIRRASAATIRSCISVTALQASKSSV
jgi:hypothetical protein